MTDVGDEVGADCLEAGPFADIVDGDQCATIFERDRLNGQHRARRADELDVLAAGHPTDRSPQMAFHGFVDEYGRVTVVGPGSNVLDQRLATSIGQHDADRQRVERAAQAEDLGLQPGDLLAGLVTLRLGYDGDSTTTKRHHGVPSPSWTVPIRGISPVSSTRRRKRWAPWCSGSQPVITNRTRSPTLTAWSPIRS